VSQRCPKRIIQSPWCDFLFLWKNTFLGAWENYFVVEFNIYVNYVCLDQRDGKEDKDLDIYRTVFPEKILLICLLSSGLDISLQCSF
jgi:hypothetical protein